MLLDLMLRHMQWADRKTFSAIRSLPKPSPDLLRLLAHLAQTEHLYLSRIRGEDPFPQDFWPDLSLVEAEDVAKEAATGLITVLSGVDQAGLMGEVSYRNSSGAPYNTPLAHLFTHIALHGSYHRGQISSRVREEGAEPPVTDFIWFVRSQPAAH